MTGSGTIRFRLTAWYTLSIALIVLGVAVTSWVAARMSLYNTIDNALARNVNTVKTMVNGHMTFSKEPDVLKALRAGGVAFALRNILIRLYDEQGALVYETDSLAFHHLWVSTPEGANAWAKFRTSSGNDGWRARLAYVELPVPAANRRYTIEVAEPLTVVDGSLTRLAGILALLVPITLAIAALGGHWLSGRALAPVERITADARAISVQNLSDRLAVPPAHDELRQLSETLNAMLERIQRSVTQIRQFTADASHELRSPLALIHTAAEFSLRRERPQEELVDALRKILRESTRTGQIVDNLLLLARADSDTIAFEPVVLDLSAVCRDVVDQGRSLAAARRLDISADLSVGRVDVKGDELALRRLFLTLVDNAIKYTPDDGCVSLALTTDRRDAVVRVTDTGVGIAVDDLPRVFDRFWRADKVRSRALGGTGLGLAIARWLVEQHGGAITVESDLGRGSTFTVRLPVSAV
jgi:heavy metal sensor kinase